jgi:hypothetical protein
MWNGGRMSKRMRGQRHSRLGVRQSFAVFRLPEQGRPVDCGRDDEKVVFLFIQNWLSAQQARVVVHGKTANDCRTPKRRSR